MDKRLFTAVKRTATALAVCVAGQRRDDVLRNVRIRIRRLRGGHVMLGRNAGTEDDRARL